MVVFCVLLYIGQKMFLIGLGIWKSEFGQVKVVVKYVFSVGYCYIDCVVIYGNEFEIGEVLKEDVGLGKVVFWEELFVIFKLWNIKYYFEDVEFVFWKILVDFQLEYLDLYLMYWFYVFEWGDNFFFKNVDGIICYDFIYYKEIWKVLEVLVVKGLVQVLGLFNFNSWQIDDIFSVVFVCLVVLQVECYLYLV